MKSYEILEHTADLRIRVFGKNPEELFKNALKGMMEYMKNPKSVPSGHLAKRDKQVRRIIKVSSPDLNALLVDFLSEVLTLADTNREIYNEIGFINFPRPVADAVLKKEVGLFLEARISGHKIDRFDRDIKAVTYHRLDIQRNKDGFWEATIVFDI